MHDEDGVTMECDFILLSFHARPTVAIERPLIETATHRWPTYRFGEEAKDIPSHRLLQAHELLEFGARSGDKTMAHGHEGTDSVATPSLTLLLTTLHLAPVAG